MEEIGTLARLISDLGPAVVVGAVILGGFWYFRNDIRGVFTSAQDRNHALVTIEGERNELTRNNTAALENNTAALGLIMSDREAMLRALDQHEKCSQERDLRSEAQNDDIQRELGKARGDIGRVETLVKERTRK